jgi:hypothetical protein
VPDSSGTSDTIVIGGKRLPRPTEGERIPAPHEGGPTSPDGSIYTVWTSPTEHHLVFLHAGDQARYVALHERMGGLTAHVPNRDGNHTLALRLNQASRWFPPPVLWLVLGIVGLAVRRPAGALALVTPAVAALLVIILDALAIPSVPHYAVPAAPAFVLLAAGALAGPPSCVLNTLIRALSMTLLCRDAADILEAQLAFHLNAGVDFVIATDHRSEDGTTEILEQHEREGHLHLIREVSEQFEQSRWVTRMARLARRTSVRAGCSTRTATSSGGRAVPTSRTSSPRFPIATG